MPSAISEKMWCRWKSWTVLSNTELALHMEEMDCCDMSGCIEVAKYLLPGVGVIQTFSGEKPDISYILVDGEWKSYDQRA